MNAEDYQKVKEIFHSVLEIEPESRGAFLDEKCAGDGALRGEVERLLSSYDSNYLEQPAVGNISGEIIAGDGLRSGQEIGHYKIVEKIGSGGMGEVYLAEDGKLERRVAIKLLPEVFTEDPDRLRRFQQEARTASALNHPNILTIHEIGETGGANYIATEYIDGETLRSKLNRERLTIGEALEIAVQTASALAAAHEAGIIHRDIKPENIMLRRDKLVKVLDFGLAKLVEKKDSSAISQDAPTDRHIQTAPGMIMGTAQYMSPEQARGHATDARTDIWSLGCVMYEMLAGRPPFAGETSADLIAEIVKTEPVPLSQIMPGCPEGLEEIIEASLKKDAEERCPAAKDLLFDLQQVRRKLDLEPGQEPTAMPWQGITAAQRNIKNLTTKTPTVKFAPSKKKTIAILPFKNLTGNAGSQFYEFSLADAVITELARLRSLIVRPSSIIAKYLGKNIDPSEAGKEMMVDSVLSAAFIYSEARVRVTAQLLDVSTGGIIWSDRIDSDARDIFALQDTITRRILDGLDFDLSLSEQEFLGQRPTKNNEAYEEYLRGRDKLGRFMFRTLLLTDCDAAIECFVRATDLDPKFALAWSGLGACFSNKVSKGIGGREEVFQARTALEKALSLNPSITEAHVLMGYLHLANGDKKNARAELDYVQREYPNTAATYFLKGLLHRLDGEYDESLESWTKLERLDPASIAVSIIPRARIYSLQGNHERALKELEIAAAAEPNHPLVKLFRVEILFHFGKVREAFRLMNLLLDENPHIDGVRPLLAVLCAAQNRRDEAYENLSENALKLAYVDCDVAYWTASAYALLGEKHAALDWLERAVNLGLGDKIWIQTDKTLDSLRDDTRFTELLGRI